MIALMYFIDSINMTLIFYYYSRVAGVAPAQDPHAQPPDMRQVVRVVHMACGVPAACSAHHWRHAVDGLRCVDSTGGPVASRDPHIPLCVWRDHGDASGRHHDTWSSHRRPSGWWPGVPRQVEGLRRGCYQHSPPPPSTFP
jgi:hypothetical protein